MLQNKAKLEKESSEIRQINIILTEKTFKRETDTMIFNNSSDIIFNVAELSSNSAQILIQMQSHIEQLKKQHQQ